MLLQTDGANLTPYTRPGRTSEVEGRMPEEGEDMRTGWVTVRGNKECQAETETEEMETPQARRNTNPALCPPPSVVVGKARWLRMEREEQERLEKEWWERWIVVREGMSEKEFDDEQEEWDRMEGKKEGGKNGSSEIIT